VLWEPRKSSRPRVRAPQDLPSRTNTTAGVAAFQAGTAGSGGAALSGLNCRRARAESRQRLAEYLLEHACVECGEIDIVVLQFDHRGDNKVADVGAMVAAGLLSDANILAAVGSHGRALSLAVLAFEESVQARALGAIVASAAQGRQPGFAEDDLRRIIYSGHRARHAAGFLQYLASEYPGIYGKAMLGISISSSEAAALQDVAGLLAAANAGSSRACTPISTRIPGHGRRRAP
jgi:AbiV family abortive infection protein